jgi:hypothetical protein
MIERGFWQPRMLGGMGLTMWQGVGFGRGTGHGTFLADVYLASARASPAPSPAQKSLFQINSFDPRS